MNTDNLKKVLSVVRDLIKRNRVAYKDYLGEETITETKVFAKGTFAENGDGLTCDDPTITGFIAGETYQITIDGETTDYVATANDVVTYVGNVTDETKPLFMIGFASGNVEWDGDKSLLGKTVSVSQTKTVTHKNYDIKKLPEELLPDSAAMDKDVKRLNSVISDVQSRVNSSVQYTPQSLTYNEKAQVRSNIGAVSKYEELDDRPCYLKKSYVTSISSTSLQALNGTNIFIALYSQSSNGIIKENKKYTSKWGYAITDEVVLQAKYATLHLANGTATSILYVGNPALLKTAAFNLQSIFGLSAKVTSVSADDIDFNFSYCWSTRVQPDGTYKNMVLSGIKESATLYQVDELHPLSDALLPDTISRTYNVGTVPKIRSINDNGKILQAKDKTWVMAPFPTIPKDYFASTDALPQHAMSANPTEDMHIATKKYVDSKEFISSSTEGSTKKFKITVDDAGTITATEVTEPST